MDSKKSSKITEIVRLQQILKKWKKLAANSSKVNAAKGTGCNSSSSVSPTGITSTNNTNNSSGSGGTSNTSKSVKFLKKTLSFSERECSSSSLNHGAVSRGSSDVVPKGYLAVCVGEELKRFVIPTEYLGHQAFGVLLREAEEEFGFQQEGVLRIPCQVALFEKILEMMDERRDTPNAFRLHDFSFTTTAAGDQLDMYIDPGSTNDNVGGYCYSPHHRQPPQMCR